MILIRSGSITCSSNSVHLKAAFARVILLWIAISLASIQANPAGRLVDSRSPAESVVSLVRETKEVRDTGNVYTNMAHGLGY